MHIQPRNPFSRAPKNGCRPFFRLPRGAVTQPVGFTIRLFRKAAVLATLLPVVMAAQDRAEFRQILERLDRLEKQNRELLDQVTALRQELAAARGTPEAPAAPPPVVELQERSAVQQQQIQDLAQSKVESSQHFPLRITGMALFNTYLNSANNGGTQNPTFAAQTPGIERGGATLRQTVVGLEFRGPLTVWGGKVHGSLYMDFFAGTGQLLDQAMRIRTASIDIDWKSRSISAGLEKPIFSPREPNSLAQVGVSPLTGTGNLWLWLPQVKVEQRIRFGPQTQLRAQVGMIATRESLSIQSGSFVPQLATSSRPGLQGRFEVSHGSEDRRIEIAPGFHTSSTHVANTSVPSNVVSVDWFIKPLSKLEITGAFYDGQNVMHLGTGAIRQGFVVSAEGIANPVRSRGGWAQAAFIATRRVTFNFFGGQQDDRDADLPAGRIGLNQKFGGNFFYRLAPNVLAGFEASQLRTSYLGSGDRLMNHYDLSFAYLF